MRSSFFWDVTQRRLVVSCGRFGTTYRSKVYGPSSPRRTGPEIVLEMSVTNYKLTSLNIPEEWRSQNFCHFESSGFILCWATFGGQVTDRDDLRVMGVQVCQIWSDFVFRKQVFNFISQVTGTSFRSLRRDKQFWPFYRVTASWYSIRVFHV